MPTFLLGPCCMDSEAIYKDSGRFLFKLMKGRNFYFKASFDKANRTSISSPRGPGFELGIKWFKEIKAELPGIKLITDMHLPEQAAKLAEVVDVIQIPAFLCRQTDLLVAAAENFNIVNIKKGQWLSPEAMCQARDKVKQTNPKAKVWLTERGTFFGYERLVVDFGNVDFLKSNFDKVILDCTHSTQRGKGNITGGDREFGKKLLLASNIFSYDGIFAEAHPNPEKALSDADSQIKLEELPKLIEKFDLIGKVANDA
jgi:2-dehydro-3-deoxyphosphooctonate aldolase (KDO 8-P synthase)